MPPTHSIRCGPSSPSAPQDDAPRAGVEFGDITSFPRKNVIPAKERHPRAGGGGNPSSNAWIPRYARDDTITHGSLATLGMTQALRTITELQNYGMTLSSVIGNRSFVALHRAITSCESTGYSPNDHFRGVTKLVVVIVMVSRYEYGIAQRMENRSTSCGPGSWWHTQDPCAG